MKKIALLCPYFGKFTPTFKPWLKSCEYNSTIDFYIFTDNKKPNQLASNIKWIEISFKKVKEKVNSALGFKANLKSAYKLCDIKPLYGDIFYEYIEDGNYDFWGFCDMDLIFGDIRAFVTEELLNEYDKIQEMGHFVLAKNTKDIRKLYNADINGIRFQKTIFKAKYNFGYDEGAKANLIGLISLN